MLVKQLSEQFKIAPSTVKKRAKRLGLLRSGRDWHFTEEQVKAIVEYNVRPGRPNGDGMSEALEAKKRLIQEYTDKAAVWLYRGNRAAEKGNHDLAERHYARSQKWHDMMIDLSGDGDAGQAEKVAKG